MEKSRILIITTGGTISSLQSGSGHVPSSSETLSHEMLRLSSYYEIDIEDLFCLDSSNIQPEQWGEIAACIYNNMNKYDGIVITHGTDTMAYTASMLSFMLTGIKIPIVLTGSQLSVQNPASDAFDNLHTACQMATSGKAGVFVAFNRKVMLGTRAVKVRAESFDAFESINHRNVASSTIHGMEIYDLEIPESKGECLRKTDISSDVCLIKLTPGLSPKIFDALPRIGIRGIVLELFGVGGIHFINRDLVGSIKVLVDSGISVVSCSQCLYDSSNLSLYEVGRKLLDVGVIEGRDMTSEAAITKLMWGIGNGMNIHEIRAFFKMNIAGEISL